MSDQAPKSAYEIAMERLRQKDAEQGIERKPVTEEQKAAIAEIRSTYEAKLAQEEVMHQSALARSVDPAARETMADEYRRTCERLKSERDSKIERIRATAPQGS
jgi:hypothetical protein